MDVPWMFLEVGLTLLAVVVANILFARTGVLPSDRQMPLLGSIALALMGPFLLLSPSLLRFDPTYALAGASFLAIALGGGEAIRRSLALLLVTMKFDTLAARPTKPHRESTVVLVDSLGFALPSLAFLSLFTIPHTLPHIAALIALAGLLAIPWYRRKYLQVVRQLMALQPLNPFQLRDEP
jgi:hypothetical protein